MTETELKSQRIKAKANLELLTLKFRAKLVTVEAVAEAKAILQNLLDYQPASEPLPAPKPVNAAVIVGTDVARYDEPTVDLPAMPVSEFTRLMEQLSVEKAGYHKQMCLLCNQLHLVPDDQNAKDLVDQIDVLYEQRKGVAVKMAFLKVNGRLPQDEGKPEAAPADTEAAKLTFMQNLPADKYELSKLLQLALPNLSKARTRLERSKDPVTRQHYSIKVAKLEAEVALTRSALKGVD